MPVEGFELDKWSQVFSVVKGEASLNRTARLEVRVSRVALCYIAVAGP